ncbi:hypothetical protein [Thioclava sp. IC9]|uniref:hypothetical protein n=1 Tax=Thioclava sp. IC9 TaxID=1973007 RepID=UPI000B539713|nr:hypothetical protein [Thioclava sp. IC9]OWY02308.1 hypothetical protein B6V76_12865 [Thioclava sp. IC9]
MFTPTEEESRSYIDGRVDRLKKQKAVSSWVSVLAVIALGAGTTQEGWSVLFAAGLMAIAYLAGSAVRALCDLHIDTLISQRRDLDRDLSLGLEGFEIQD